MLFRLEIFQSTHPRGVRHVDFWEPDLPIEKFQSTHPRGVRLLIVIQLALKCVYFNPRTREGCDLGIGGADLSKAIFQSTHPRGVRLSSYKDSNDGKLFQSTHPRGVRRAKTFLCQGLPYQFQSTHPRGVRQVIDGDCPFNKVISIHAPARGATTLRVFYVASKIYFNPRTREGCDINFHLKMLGLCLFQSTHPRGVRHITNVINTEDYKISIHAPARGATEISPSMQALCNKFQSTHPRGVRPSETLEEYLKLPFQSTHPRGVRLSNC